MSILSKLTQGVAAAALGLVAMTLPLSALAETKIRIQSVIPNSADEVVMLQDFAEDVKQLTQGEVVFEVLPAGAVVGGEVRRVEAAGHQ